MSILPLDRLKYVHAVDEPSEPSDAAESSTLGDVRAEVSEQRRLVTRWHGDALKLEPTSRLRHAARRVHACNFVLWHLEDLARDPDAPDPIIATIKRRIDAVNQTRSDVVELLDETICALFESRPTRGARLHSETVGALVDRLSINALKLSHAEDDTQAAELRPPERERARARRAILADQRRDLTSCLGALVRDLEAGRARIKVYRQVKTYNDAELNPVLRGARRKRERRDSEDSCEGAPLSDK